MGSGGPSASRPSLMNTTRRSVTWHPEQMNVWCSTPRTATVSSETTVVRINSPVQALQRITRTPTALTYRALTPLLPKLCSRLRRSHSRSIQLPQAVHQRARIASANRCCRNGASVFLKLSINEDAPCAMMAHELCRVHEQRSIPWSRWDA